MTGAQPRPSRLPRPLSVGRSVELRPVAIAAVVGVLVVGGAILMVRELAPDLIGPPSQTPSADPSASLPAVVVPSASDPSGEPTPSAVVNPTGVWVATGEMGTPREGHIAVRLLDGRVLVAGGQGDPDGQALTSAELYDPVTGTWSATGDMIQTNGVFPATVLRDGKVLVGHVIEDEATESYTMGAEVYDPVTGTWSATGPMVLTQETTGSMTATLLTDGQGAGDGSRSFRAVRPGLWNLDRHEHDDHAALQPCGDTPAGWQGPGGRWRRAARSPHPRRRAV